MNTSPGTSISVGRIFGEAGTDDSAEEGVYDSDGLDCWEGPEIAGRGDTKPER